MTQLEKCLIKAPADGMVIYANEYGWRGNQERQIEEGAAVRERQSLIKLPDLTNMQAKTLIHESKIETMQLGMRARVTVQDQEFQGEVTYIANQAEPPSPFSPSVKRYSTIVKIDGESSSLRPGMTAEVQILVANLSNVITVPEQAVAEIGGEYFCFVPNGTSDDQRKVTLGMSDGTHIEIKSGLREGEKVYQNPRRFVSGANSIGDANQSVDVSKRFGDSNRGPSGLGAGVDAATGGPEMGGRGARRGGRGPAAGDGLGVDGAGPGVPAGPGGPDDGAGRRRGGPVGPDGGGPGSPGQGREGVNPNAGGAGLNGPGAAGGPAGGDAGSFGSPREGRGRPSGPPSSGP
jgi:hypothetical protein